ncbi:MAG: retropepsin-like aspartic protease [Sphingobacterium hotanense]
MKSTINFLTLSALLLSSLSTKAQEKQLTQLLSERFSIAGFTHQAADYCLSKIQDQRGFSFVELKELPDQQASIILKDNNGKLDTSIARLDAQGKIKQIDLFDRLYGIKRAANPKLIAKIPFENKNGSILLKLSINGTGKTLNMLFDTGADGMALDEKRANEIGLKVTRENNASVVGGTQQIKVSDGNYVEIGDLKMDNMSIAIFPSRPDDHSDGIIGNSILRRYITHIDYDHNELSLFEFGDFKYPGEGKLIPITFPQGVIHLHADLSITGEAPIRGEFIFDTGAGYSLIAFRPFVKEHKLLVSGFKSEVSSTTSSLGTVTPTFTGIAQSLALENMEPMLNFPISLMGGSSANKDWNPGADGSLGVRAISRYNHYINLLDGEIYLSKNKLNTYPSDFLIRDYLFGWNNQGHLILLERIGTPNSPEKGKRVISIDRILDSKLAKNSKSIEKLRGLPKDKKINVSFFDETKITIE